MVNHSCPKSTEAQSRECRRLEKTKIDSGTDHKDVRYTHSLTFYLGDSAESFNFVTAEISLGISEETLETVPSYCKTTRRKCPSRLSGPDSFGCRRSLASSVLGRTRVHKSPNSGYNKHVQ